MHPCFQTPALWMKLDEHVVSEWMKRGGAEDRGRFWQIDQGRRKLLLQMSSDYYLAPPHTVFIRKQNENWDIISESRYPAINHSSQINRPRSKWISHSRSQTLAAVEFQDAPLEECKCWGLLLHAEVAPSDICKCVTLLLTSESQYQDRRRGTVWERAIKALPPCHLAHFSGAIKLTETILDLWQSEYSDLRNDSTWGGLVRTGTSCALCKYTLQKKSPRWHSQAR